MVLPSLKYLYLVVDGYFAKNILSTNKRHTKHVNTQPHGNIDGEGTRGLHKDVHLLTES